MMKIAVLDFMFPKGHINFSSKIINILSKLSYLYIADNGSHKNLPSGHKIIKVPNLTKVCRGTVSTRIVQLLYMILERVKLFREDIDKVVVLNFDIIAFAIGRFFYRNNSLYVFHHQYIDELKNKRKLYIFKLYMNKINHIVFAEYFKTYLVDEIGVNKELIFVIPHPLQTNKNENTLSTRDQQEKKQFVGISHSNDEKVIEEIISFEEKYNILKKNRCKVILKSKSKHFNNGYLNVSNEFYSDEKYNELFNSSKAVLLLFPREYEYRMSGTFFDAFIYGVPVIARDIKLTSYLKDLYPKSINSFSTISELMDILINGESNVNVSEMKKMYEMHSDENILSLIISMLERKSNGS